MTTTNSWFEVDRKGLAKLLERRGKAWALFELISNAWDTDAKKVDISLTPQPGLPLVQVEIVDDDPNGFANLADAWTVFAESTRKASADKRGRFGLGEKLVIALCNKATISSTTGSVSFDAEGRHMSRSKTASGSKFEGLLRMNREEYQEAFAALKTLIPPRGCQVIVNGEKLQSRWPLAARTASLMTEIADEEGILRRVPRQTAVYIYEPLSGEVPSIYELGVPVVETGDKYHVEVMQKVPLSTDRDNVSPAYLRTLRGLVLDALAKDLTKAEAAETWVTAGLGATTSAEAVKAVSEAKFGKRAVIYDPSDPGASQNAQAQGYVVVHGGMLPADAWERVRDTKALLPAGQVTPDRPKFGPDVAKRANYDMREVGALHENVVLVLKAITPEVKWTVALYDDPDAGWGGLHTKLGEKRSQMSLNLAGRELDPHGKFTESILDVLLHEAAHHFEPSHLHTRYHEAATSLGAKLALFAARRPEMFV